MPPVFVLLQYLLPQHLLSRAIWLFTRVRWAPFKNALIGWFVRSYGIDLGDSCVSNWRDFASFNAFFTRALQPWARPLTQRAGALACPVDGTVSQLGALHGAQLLQAKGHHYSLQQLLSEAAPVCAAQLQDGQFATLYLAPYNYHRIHMPCDGRLVDAWHVPGALFSVNATTAASVPALFARNERVVLLFEGAAGPFVLVLVGALFVGSMTTIWHGDITPRSAAGPTRLLPVTGASGAQLGRGDELGRFNMGSTVILLFGPQQAQWRADLAAGTTVRMGEDIGTL